MSFLDFGGHGYSIVHATRDWLEVEFVCIPRPIERSTGREGGPLRYRVAHRVQRWGKGERPRLEQRVIEGSAQLSI
jgi:alkaline phosphatase D